MILTVKVWRCPVVLNGLAEFIRNLLVCKDEKAARLMEVVSFPWQVCAYCTTGISGLSYQRIEHIEWSETKAARNKRLHVWSLIKLTYLQRISVSLLQTKVGKKRLRQQNRCIPQCQWGKKADALQENGGNTAGKGCLLNTAHLLHRTRAKLIIEGKVPYQTFYSTSTTSWTSGSKLLRVNTCNSRWTRSWACYRFIRQQFANRPTHGNTAAISAFYR